MESTAPKKMTAVIIGVISGLISILFLPALAKALISAYFYGGENYYNWLLIYLYVSVDILKSESPYLIMFILLLPMVYCMNAIELAGVIIKLNKSFFVKTIGMIFQLWHVAFILLFLIHFTVVIVFNIYPEHEWQTFAAQLNWSFQKKIIAALGTAIIPFSYTSYALNRIKYYLAENE